MPPASGHSATSAGTWTTCKWVEGCIGSLRSRVWLPAGVLRLTWHSFSKPAPPDALAHVPRYSQSEAPSQLGTAAAAGRPPWTAAGACHMHAATSTKPQRICVAVTNANAIPAIIPRAVARSAQRPAAAGARAQLRCMHDSRAIASEELQLWAGRGEICENLETTSGCWAPAMA